MFWKHHHSHPAGPAPAERAAFLQELLDRARTYDGVTGAEAASASAVPLKKGERLLFVVQGAVLVEPRREAGHWQGGSRGVSIPVPGLRGVRYRVGATHGTYVQGSEKPTPIDTGTFSITTARAVFVGPKQTREWAWTRLLGITHETDAPWTAIAVSNRQKTSGVAYDTSSSELVRFYLDLAVAIAHDDRAPLVQHLTDELHAVLPSLPAPPPGPPPSGTAAPPPG